MTGAVKKLLEDRAEKEKGYKCQFDVERVRSLAHSAHLLKDLPITISSALSAAIARELAAINAKQTEAWLEEQKKLDQEMIEAKVEDAPKPVEEEHKSTYSPRPVNAPGVGRI